MKVKERMKKVFKNKVSMTIIALVSIVAIVLCNNLLKKSNELIGIDEAQKLLATRETKENQIEEDIYFNAFFLRDSDGDGKAEEFYEIDNEIEKQMYLYSEIRVNTEGYLKDGRISIEAGNFTFKTNLVSSSIVDGNHIGQTNEIKLKSLSNGTQALMYGSVESNIYNNINNYNGDSKVILTGVLVNDEGIETNIEKVINLRVNWYGTTRTSIESLMQKYNIDNAIKEETFDVTFKLQVNEKNRQLLLQKQEIKAIIPKIMGYNPISVELNNSNVQSNYDDESGILTINRESIIDENGNVKQMISNDFSSLVSVKYPIEAFNLLGKDYVILDIQEEASTYGFNSQKEGYNNPYVSTDRDIVTAVFEHIEKTEIIGKKPTNILYATNAIGWNYKSPDGLKYKAIPKDSAINLYNGNIYNENNTTYPVYWQLRIVNTKDIEKVIIEDETEELDCFYNNSGNRESMRDFITIKQIAFDGLEKVLGENGWLSIYNADNGKLISKNSVSNWNRYTESNPYRLWGVKSIRVETSAPIQDGDLTIYQLKSIDNEKLVEHYSAKEQFDDLKYIGTYLKTTLEIIGGIKDTHNYAATALYKERTSNVKLNIDKDEFLTDSTENMELTIDAYNENGMGNWKDGIFVIEFPEEIVDININEVSASNEKVNIISYQLYTENNKKFIRINTQNDEALAYSIKVNADAYIDPISSSVIRDVNLYAYNNYCDNYDKKAEDIYDIDGDLTYSDYVAYNNKNIKIYAPFGLVTSEFITDYDENGSKTVAPNVAEIDKGRENASINIRIANNYDRAIRDIVILGKIPFDGNEFVLNDKELGSEFTANIVGPISVPDELVSYANVYYSTEESPSKDLENESNGWLTVDEVEEWNNIKSYMIDLGDYRVSKNQIKDFSYLVHFPEDTNYNEKTYSAHAVYYALETMDGLYYTSVQPNKVGIEIVKKFDLELTKNKVNFDNITVKGAQYSVTYTDVNGKEVSKVATTDTNGKIVIEDLPLGKECTIQEISCSNDYELNLNKIKFIANLINREGNDNLELNVLSGNFKNEPIKSLQENGKYTVKANVEDEARYSLRINKKNGEDLITDKVTFTISGKDKADIYKTVDGITVIDGLHLNEEYKIIEVEADGYYIDGQEKVFKIIRNENTKELEIVSENSEFLNGTIIENINGQSQVNVTIKNEKIPKYNLQIVKVKKNKEESTETIPLSGAVFKLIDNDSGTEQNYTTDNNGCIDISDLNKYVEGKHLSGIYTIQEVYPPEGYISNNEQIKFKVTSNSDGSTEYNIENRESLTSIKDVVFENNVLKIIIEDLPILNIIKIDSETEERIPNVGFTIQSVDIAGNVTGYAKDGEGNYIGQKNQNGEYVVLTDENGILQLPLKEGMYKLKEVEIPEGYESSEPIFFSVGQEDDKKEKVIITSIEDLVDFSNSVSNGDTYSGKTVLLAKTLDFNDDSSYDDLTSTEYGDLNGDGIIESIKIELTKTSGKGFSPIGNKTNNFSGIFNGNGNEIKNLYINRNQESSVGLFSYGKGTIKNLGISGIIKSTYRFSNSDYEEVYAGGIVGHCTNGKIINCHSSATVTATTSGNANNSFVYAGGVTGCSYAYIYNCYNMGNVTTNNGITSFSGGITGCAFSDVNSCYNTGTITGGDAAGGIVGTARGGLTVKNCYNTGKIVNNASNQSTYAGSGGIIGQSSFQSTIRNCYNTGIVQGKRSEQLTPYYNYNSYYLAETSDGNKAVSEFDLISKDFYAKLNVDDVWYYDIGSSPKLLNISEILSNSITEENIEVRNILKTFSVTTEVDGGIGGSISGQNDEVYEKIKYDQSNKKEILMIPEEGYKIVNITVNGKEIKWQEDNNGNYTIPADYFTNVKEDKHIVVKYYPKNQLLKINKVDAEDENMKLSGAKFRVEESLMEDTIKVNDVLGKLEPYYSNSEYYFVENTDGSYIANNQYSPKNYTTAYSKMSIDLRNKEETYYLDIKFNTNAEFWSYSSNVGAIASIILDGNTIYSSNTNYDVKRVQAAMEGGKRHSLEFKFENRGTRYYFKIQSIDVNYGTKYSFENNGSKYTSENQGQHSSLAYLCVPVDLTSYNRNYELKVNAEISSEANKDYGYAIVSQSSDIPSYSDTNGRFIYISGNVKAKDYTTTLQGGNKYYLHIGYYKNNSVNNGTDTFTINDITLSNEVTTNENGEILLNLLEKEYRVTEIEAPENYILNTETQTITLGKNDDNELTFSNQLKPKVIVHHYLKENGEYTNKKVAEDEIIYGDLAKEYTTEPHIDLKKLNIEKDLEGNNVIPENARGIYSNEDIEVNYYYEVEPIKLTIKHLVEGTENRIVEDEIIETKPTVNFDENGNYNVYVNESYILETNENYNSIIQNYGLVYIHCELKDTVYIEDIIQYSEDTEIIYYYDAIPVKYYIHYFYDEIEDLSKLEEKTDYLKIPINRYPDKAEIGYYLDKVEALNINGETTSLPLIIGKTEENNVINVYYKKIKENHTVEKVWEGLNDLQAESYTSTIVLQKTVNGVTTNCKDDNNQDITITLVGNDTYTFENLLSYEGNEKITYSVKEICVVKNNTIELTEDEYLTQYETISKLSDKITNILVRQYKIQKQWNITNENEVNNYKSTFTLYKTDGTTEPQMVKDDLKIVVVKEEDSNGVVLSKISETEENNVNGSVVGNGKITFIGLPKYQNGKELIYSVEETKVEKTTNNGSTWEERNLNNFVIIHNSSTEVDDLIENSRLFNITTEIKASEKASGTITGEFNEIYLEENNIRYVETISENDNATRDIEIVPDNGYCVSDVSINGKKYEFVTDENGKVTIPKSNFENVSEDQHIIVTFGENEKTITINKTDESGNPLKGAKFRITSNFTRKDTDMNLSSLISDMNKLDSDSEYYFEYNSSNGTYTSNNQNQDSTTAVGYKIVDLSELNGNYNLIINAKVSSESGYDNGYVVISEFNGTEPSAATSTSTSTSTSTGTGVSMISIDELSNMEYLFKISGQESSRDYTKQLEGGKKYIVYFAYGKDGSASNGSDTFTINSISLDSESAPVIAETELTDENGEATVTLKGYGTYTIEEIVTPEHYVTMSNKEFELLASEDNQIVTIENEHKPTVLVHHYYKNANGEYTTNKVAPDEETEGNIGQRYTTSAKTNLAGLQQEKVNGTTVRPVNYTGTYANGRKIVNYYYEAIPVTLTIHHYTEGTTENLKEDETVNTVPTVTFPSDGTYSITSEFEYDLGENNNYKELIQNKTFVKVVNNTSGNSVLNIDENLDYTANTTITYFYREAETYSYTIHYKEQGTENELKTDKYVEGILASEIVTEDPASIDGYTVVNPLSVEMSVDNNEHTFYYTKRTDLTYKVKYMEENTETEIATAKTGEGQTFGKTVQEEAIDIEGFTKIEPTTKQIQITTGTNEIVFYYARRNDLSYTVNYLKQGTNEVLSTAKVYSNQPFGKVITSSNEVINIDNYTFRVADKESLTLGLDNTANVINLYYSLRNDLSYTVNYYEKGTTNAIKTAKVVDNQIYGTEIISSNEVIEIPGYMYDSVNKSTITISSDETQNVINVYYVFALKVKTEVVEHTERYSNGTTTNVKGGTITGEDNANGYLELVGKGRDATTPIVITPNTGYRITKITVNENELDVNSYIDTNGKVTLSAENCNYLKTITEDIEVKAEFAKESKVVVKYLEKETEEEVASEEVIEGIEGQSFETSRKEVEDYREAEVNLTRNGEPTGETASKTYKGFYVEGDLTEYSDENNVMYANTLTVIYWYEKIPKATLTVKYIEVDEEDISSGLTLSSGREIDSESYVLKVGETVDTVRRTITDTETGRKYIAVDGPRVLRSTIGNVEGTKVVILHKDENSYTETIEEVDSNNDGKIDSVEVRYYYKRQYKITATVEGGTFEDTESTETTEITEIVNRKGNNTRKMVVRPASEDYEIKSVKINGREINLETLIDTETGLITIKENYFEDGVTEDKNIVIVFQKIQTKVIAKYIDIETNEEIIPEEIEIGDIGAEYTVTRKELAGYEKAGEEPINSTGTRTKEDIVVTYYYKKAAVIPNPETNTQTNTTEENEIINNIIEEEMHTPKMSNIARRRRAGNVKTGDKIFAFVSLFILSLVGFAVGETNRIHRYGKHKK